MCVHMCMCVCTYRTSSGLPLRLSLCAEPCSRAGAHSKRFKWMTSGQTLNSLLVHLLGVMRIVACERNASSLLGHVVCSLPQSECVCIQLPQSKNKLVRPAQRPAAQSTRTNIISILLQSSLFIKHTFSIVPPDTICYAKNIKLKCHNQILLRTPNFEI